jgi:hypothetical protein
LARSKPIVVISLMDGSVPGDSPETPVWHLDAARGPSTPSLDQLVGAASSVGGTSSPRAFAVFRLIARWADQPHRLPSPHPACGGGRQDAIPDPSPHAAPCLRVQARERWPRHPSLQNLILPIAFEPNPLPKRQIVGSHFPPAIEPERGMVEAGVLHRLKRNRGVTRSARPGA